MTLDELCARACGEGIEIDDVRMRELREVCFPEGWIAMDSTKYTSRTEYKCDLAHAVGHCETGAFYNLYSRFDLKEKSERKANIRAVEILMPLGDVRRALRRGTTDLWSLSEQFDVTPDFAAMALGIYADDLLKRPHRREVSLPPMMKARDLLPQSPPPSSDLGIARTTSSPAEEITNHHDRSADIEQFNRDMCTLKRLGIITDPYDWRTDPLLNLPDFDWM